MKGLALSRAYFEEAFLPLLRRSAPQMLPLLAAGLVGEGSDCFGFDDARSRDHDWGPGFCLWLPAAEKDRVPDLEALLQTLPATFGGFPARPMVPRGRMGVFTVEEFYTSLLGRPDAPKTAATWLSIPEPSLAAATNGAVFLDNAGTFSAVREGLLAYYPEDVRLRRLASSAAVAAQTGQYNYSRCAGRGDDVAAAVILGRFLENAAAMVFLLNRRFRPFYKWTYHAMAGLPLLGQTAKSAMERIISAAPGKEAAMEIEALSALLIGELRRQGISGDNSDFLMDHCGAILSGIRDPRLREQPLSLIF